MATDAGTPRKPCPPHSAACTSVSQPLSRVRHIVHARRSGQIGTRGGKEADAAGYGSEWSSGERGRPAKRMQMQMWGAAPGSQNMHLTQMSAAAFRPWQLVISSLRNRRPVLQRECMHSSQTPTTPRYPQSSRSEAKDGKGRETGICPKSAPRSLPTIRPGSPAHVSPVPRSNLEKRVPRASLPFPSPRKRLSVPGFCAHLRSSSLRPLPFPHVVKAMSETETVLQLPADFPAQSTSTSAGDATVVALAHSVSGRVSGKAWKLPKTATVYAPRPQFPSVLMYLSAAEQTVTSARRCEDEEVGGADGEDEEGAGHQEAAVRAQAGESGRHQAVRPPLPRLPSLPSRVYLNLTYPPRQPPRDHHGAEKGC